MCQLIVRLKTIESIEELFGFLSSYINLLSSDFCSPRHFYWYNNNKGI